ncbi:MAG: endo alpha-1,4 polygalactosaminidase, partial [Nannocystaceae bacterium]|nr:endo alpha-1,4 polygalactosaminidase [Nannocystaceae bacterium]
DAVEPDNVDGYTNPTGFDLTADDQLDYNRWLATAAHDRGLSVGLKNDVDQVEALVDEFDWALNEECVTYEECETTSPFIEQGKAVFHVEYVDDTADGPALVDTVCPQTSALGFSTLIKEWDLTAWRLAC